MMIKRIPLNYFKLFTKKILPLAGICIWYTAVASAPIDTTTTSTRQQAILFIENIQSVEASSWWPRVKPDLFLHNIKDNIYNPLALYEGSNTNFCGYAALSYLPLHDDPLGYAKFMLELYREGKATWGKVTFNPSPAIRQAAGTLIYKGNLDIRPAEQIWFLSLADHFKSYLNFLNRRYNPGDENTFWASVTYGKFNRMAKALFNYKVNARGSDLIRAHIADPYNYISDALKTGTVVLFVNNKHLTKKNHRSLKAGLPTHFIILLGISRSAEGLISITYWDYGFPTMRQVSPAFLKKILFGVSHCTIKTANAQ